MARAKSYVKECGGGPAFGRWLKEERVGMAYVQTDDWKCDMAMLLPSSNGELKLGFCSSTEHGHDMWGRRRKERWDVVSVDPKRVVDYRRLSD